MWGETCLPGRIYNFLYMKSFNMNSGKANQKKDQKKKEKIDTPIPPQRMDPNKKMKEQDKGGKDRNERK